MLSRSARCLDWATPLSIKLSVQLRGDQHHLQVLLGNNQSTIQFRAKSTEKLDVTDSFYQ